MEINHIQAHANAGKWISALAMLLQHLGGAFRERDLIDRATPMMPLHIAQRNTPTASSVFAAKQRLAKMAIHHNVYAGVFLRRGAMLHLVKPAVMRTKPARHSIWDKMDILGVMRFTAEARAQVANELGVKASTVKQAEGEYRKRNKLPSHHCEQPSMTNS